MSNDGSVGSAPVGKQLPGPSGAYRMIVIDLDGTLLSPMGEVSPRTRAAVHSALAAGLLVCFATGRTWIESKMVLDAVEHYPTAVFAGGALVMDTHQEVTLHRTRMEPRLAAEVCRMMESMGHAALALEESGPSGVVYLVTQKVQVNQETRAWMNSTRSTIRPVPSLSDYEHPHTIRVGMVALPAQTQEVAALLRQQLGDRILCQSLHVPGQEVEVLEVFDPAVNKWEGVLHLARRHGVAPEQIVAIGDDVNDLPMMRNAGLGVAMGNAKPVVKEAAARVIGSNSEDGLAIFLEELVSGHLVAPENQVAPKQE